MMLIVMFNVITDFKNNKWNNSKGCVQSTRCPEELK